MAHRMEHAPRQQASQDLVVEPPHPSRSCAPWRTFGVDASRQGRRPGTQAAQEGPSLAGGGYSSSSGGGTREDASSKPSRARALSGSSCKAFLKLSAATRLL